MLDAIHKRPSLLLSVSHPHTLAHTPPHTRRQTEGEAMTISAEGEIRFNSHSAMPERMLSNMYDSEMLLSVPDRAADQQLRFHSVEQYYQYCKTNDAEARRRVLSTATGYAARRVGKRNVPIRSDWDHIKQDVMRTALRVKFAE